MLKRYILQVYLACWETSCFLTNLRREAPYLNLPGQHRSPLLVCLFPRRFASRTLDPDFVGSVAKAGVEIAVELVMIEMGSNEYPSAIPAISQPSCMKTVGVLGNRSRSGAWLVFFSRSVFGLCLVANDSSNLVIVPRTAGVAIIKGETEAILKEI